MRSCTIDQADTFDRIDLMGYEEEYLYEPSNTIGFDSTWMKSSPYSYIPCITNPFTPTPSSRSRRCIRILSYIPFVLLSSLLAIALVRIATIFFETWEMVRGERIAEENFLLLCAEGHARESPHMQKGCMQASAAGASPILLAVLGRSSASIMHEIWATMSHPLQSFSIAGVVGVCSLLSWVPSIRNVFAAPPTPATYGHNDDRVVVIQSPTNSSWGRARQRPVNAPLMMRSVSPVKQSRAPASLSNVDGRPKKD